MDNYVRGCGRILSDELAKVFPAAVVGVFRPIFIDCENRICRAIPRLRLAQALRGVRPGALPLVRGPYRVTDDAEIDFHAPSILKAATEAEKIVAWLSFGAEKAVPETSPAESLRTGDIPEPECVREDVPKPGDLRIRLE